MRCTRNLFLAPVVTLTAMLLAASSASAITVRQEPGNTACPAGPTVNAHVVSGGCHLTFASSGAGTTLLAHTGAAEITISNCTISGELRVNSAGVGFVTNQVFTGGASCTRAPCDEAVSMRKIPWSAAITGTAAAPAHESTMCLRTIASGEGGAGTNCTVHTAVSFSGHTYSESSTEGACEGNPAVELIGGGTATATERIEIS